MRELSAINVGFGELWSLAVDIQGIQLPRTVKTAIITGNPVQYGIARMFQAILTHPQMKVEMFSDEVEADKWLSAID
jgi:NhaP-type Na+/H+ and K+/H+ antiporter